jgi:magnesium-transporting ATPase (P-type)
MISVTATVLRGGTAREIPLAELVSGDIVKLAAGDMIPADIRILTCKDLFLTQASLTGEPLVFLINGLTKYNWGEVGFGTYRKIAGQVRRLAEYFRVNDATTGRVPTPVGNSRPES